MARFATIHSATYKGCVYRINADHIIMLWKEEDEKVRLMLSNGSILYPKESEEEIIDEIRRQSK